MNINGTEIVPGDQVKLSRGRNSVLVDVKDFVRYPHDLFIIDSYDESWEVGHNWSIVGVNKPQQFTAVSSTGVGVYNLVLLGTELSCSCKGYEYRKDCRHVQEYRKALGLTA